VAVTLQGSAGVVRDAFAYQLERIAADVGRLRRRHCADDYTGHLLDRIGGSVDTLDTLIRPRASEIYRANLWECGDEDESVKAALEDVDARVRDIRTLLGEKAA
jgi:hypothetical protein